MAGMDLWVVVAQRGEGSSRETRAVCWRQTQAEAEEVVDKLRLQQEMVIAFSERWLRAHPLASYALPATFVQCTEHRWVDGVCVECGTDPSVGEPTALTVPDRPEVRRWRDMRAAFEEACEPMLDQLEWFPGLVDEPGPFSMPSAGLLPLRSTYLALECPEEVK